MTRSFSSSGHASELSALPLTGELLCGAPIDCAGQGRRRFRRAKNLDQTPWTSCATGMIWQADAAGSQILGSVQNFNQAGQVPLLCNSTGYDALLVGRPIDRQIAVCGSIWMRRDR